MSPLPDISPEQYERALLAEKLELKCVALWIAPLFWVIADSDGQCRVRNGTAFFLDLGAGPFAVTAAHVIKGYKEARETSKVVALQLGDLSIDFDGPNELIDPDLNIDIDIATFRIDRAQIESIGKTVWTCNQSQWPPVRPQEGQRVYVVGFPEKETLFFESNREFNFGLAAGGGIVSNVSETNVSSQIEREYLIPLNESGIPPENYNFSGISGGPMIARVETGGISSLSLAGVIRQGPSTSSDPTESIPGFEVIWARRARFLLPDGRLDRRAWDDLN